MADSILSQAEIDALLRKGTSTNPHKQLNSAFQTALDSANMHFQVLIPHAVHIEGPYVEQVQQKLDVLFIEDVYVVPMSMGPSELYAFIGISEAEQLAHAMGGDVEWALQTTFDGWAKHLAEGFSEVYGKYIPHSLGDPIQLSRKQLSILPVDEGSVLVRHAVCWSKDCIEVCFYLPGSKLPEADPEPIRIDAKSSPAGAARGSMKGRATMTAPQMPVRTAVFSELAAPARDQGDLPLGLVRDVELDVVVELGHTTMTLQDLMDMEPNSTFALHRPAGDPVDVLIGGNAVARAEVTVVNDQFGIRILDIVPENERIPNVEDV